MIINFSIKTTIYNRKEYELIQSKFIIILKISMEIKVFFMNGSDIIFVKHRNINYSRKIFILKMK